jgi:hypothetical protein
MKIFDSNNMLTLSDWDWIELAGMN